MIFNQPSFFCFYRTTLSAEFPRSNFVRLLPKGRKNSAASIDGSLQLPLSQGGKTSHQKQTFFSGGNSCVHSTSHNLFFSGKDYSLPQDVFMDPQNWNSNGFQYSWPGSAFIRLNIVATHAVGKTIFWRPEKNDNNYE
ncbi:MAG: hypothetical protein II065_08460 [Bacteroidaceae bacterium]|nr:hypothetical protein [Bacteroidaceae bacterium]